MNWKDILDFNIINNLPEPYFPPKDKVFRAFELCAFEDTRVLILGQDPYHGQGQADGLAFSVDNSVNAPPSLKNIFKELNSDIGIDRTNKNLEGIALQGVLLLNTVLTVAPNLAGSHKNIGWEEFTDSAIQALNNKQTPVVFVLWGNFAKSKIKLITNPIHHIITGVHPSPLSAYRGFFGSKPFSEINSLLDKKIDFSL